MSVRRRKAATTTCPGDVHANAEVVDVDRRRSPTTCEVIVATSHKLGAFGERKRLLDRFGPAANGEAPFDVLFVDEAWQLPHHLFDKVARLAPITVGVGDVGQLPPLEIGTNPWRGDPGYNPYRAWPTDFDGDDAHLVGRAAGGLAAGGRHSCRSGARSTPSGASSTASPRRATGR